MVKLTQRARAHKVGRAHIEHVLKTVVPVEVVTNRGEEGWLYIGPDDRGLELELIVVEQHDHLLVIHAMPTSLRRN